MVEIGQEVMYVYKLHDNIFLNDLIIWLIFITLDNSRKFLLFNQFSYTDVKKCRMAYLNTYWGGAAFG